MVTLTVSCFFHQSFGIPEPDKFDGAPLVNPPGAFPKLTLLFGVEGKRGFVLHGSSEEYAGAGERMLFCL